MTAGNAIHTRTFTRTKLYVRVALTIAGTTPEVPVAVLIGQQKKTM
jgi:hypothetical protein